MILEEVSFKIDEHKTMQPYHHTENNEICALIYSNSCKPVQY